MVGWLTRNGLKVCDVIHHEASQPNHKGRFTLVTSACVRAHPGDHFELMSADIRFTVQIIDSRPGKGGWETTCCLAGSS
jgi:hypothetical protein